MEMLEVKSNKKFYIKYLIAGLINTLFGYCIGLVNFFLLYERFGIIYVSILNNILAITFSFLNYKFFVFKTSKSLWLKEYFKIYIVYVISFLISTFILWLCIEILFINIYYSQAISIFSTVLISYFFNKSFTFKN